MPPVAKELFIDQIIKPYLDRTAKIVKTKDMDFVMVIDGREGCGKSVLAMQIAKYFDKDFNINKMCFNSEEFLKALREQPSNSCIVLDEAWACANARASLTDVNKALIGVATEMRQRNLFVIIVIPSFFDLDRYFALWRCTTLFHVYLTKEGNRGKYIVFPASQKKMLYLQGKKYYLYTKPKSPLPPCNFNNFYVLDEYDYRLKKASAFNKRAVSNRELRWQTRTVSLLRLLHHHLKIPLRKIERLMKEVGSEIICNQEMSSLLNKNSNFNPQTLGKGHFAIAESQTNNKITSLGKTPISNNRNTPLNINLNTNGLSKAK